MSPLDVFLLLAAGIAGIFGYRRGGIVGLALFAGVALGASAGMFVAVRVTGPWEAGRTQTIAAVLILVLCSSLAQALFQLGGTRLHRRITGPRGRYVDAGFGVVVASVSLLVVAWGSSVILQNAPVPGISAAIADSTVLNSVHRAVPEPAARLLLSYGQLFSTAALPDAVIRDPDPLPGIEPPPRHLLQDPDIRAARESIVSVLGEAESCNKRVTGSGFVYAPGLVLTNAHVVAGVRKATVRIGGTGRPYTATVVAFNPRRDVAVLAVEDLPAPPLRLSDNPLQRNDGAVLAGFPGGGRFLAVPARVRERLTVRGPDIYDRARVSRKVVVLHGRIAPGTSGGPLLLADGTVGGLIFAKSLENDDTAYALQLGEVASAASLGQRNSAPVDTGDCAN